MFLRVHHISSLAILLVSFCTGIHAQPSNASSQVIGDQRIYRDIKQGNLFYYIPFDYKLVTDASGKPEFSMIQMRYTGTRATADAASRWMRVG